MSWTEGLYFVLITAVLTFTGNTFRDESRNQIEIDDLVVPWYALMERSIASSSTSGYVTNSTVTNLIHTFSCNDPTGWTYTPTGGVTNNYLALDATNEVVTTNQIYTGYGVQWDLNTDSGYPEFEFERIELTGDRYVWNAWTQYVASGFTPFLFVSDPNQTYNYHSTETAFYSMNSGYQRLIVDIYTNSVNGCALLDFGPQMSKRDQSWRPVGNYYPAGWALIQALPASWIGVSYDGLGLFSSYTTGGFETARYSDWGGNGTVVNQGSVVTNMLRDAPAYMKYNMNNTFPPFVIKEPLNKATEYTRIGANIDETGVEPTDDDLWLDINSDKLSGGNYVGCTNYLPCLLRSYVTNNYPIPYDVSNDYMTTNWYVITNTLNLVYDRIQLYKWTRLADGYTTSWTGDVDEATWKIGYGVSDTSWTEAKGFAETNLIVVLTNSYGSPPPQSITRGIYTDLGGGSEQWEAYWYGRRKKLKVETFPTNFTKEVNFYHQVQAPEYVNAVFDGNGVYTTTNQLEYMENFSGSGTVVTSSWIGSVSVPTWCDEPTDGSPTAKGWVFQTWDICTKWTFNYLP